jgi:hypothetical protein
MGLPLGPHYCTGCGEMHGGKPPENPEVAIARLQAERDIEVARINRGEFQKTELEAETEIKVAEIEAGAEVATAEATAETVAAVLGSSDGEEAPPVVIEAPPEEIGPEEPSIEPAGGNSGPPEPKKPKLSYWP